MNFKPVKVKRFNEYTLNDYKRSLFLEEITEVTPVDKTDGSFTQIGMRPLLDDDIFISESMSEYLPGSGRLISAGERDFLINYLLKNEEIEHVEFSGNFNEIPAHTLSNNSIIIISTKFYVGFFTQLMRRIDYDKKYPRLDGVYRIVSVPEDLLGNKIIILDKDAVLWKRQIFDNKVLGTKEPIDIFIEPRPAGKVAITIKSVNKIEHINPERIKILEVKR